MRCAARAESCGVLQATDSGQQSPRRPSPRRPNQTGMSTTGAPVQLLFFRLVAHRLPIIFACVTTCAFLSPCAAISYFARRLRKTRLRKTGLLLASRTRFLACIHHMCAALSLRLCSHFRLHFAYSWAFFSACGAFSAWHARLFVCLALACGFRFGFAWVER